MFVHEYSDEYFDSYEDCRDDLMSEIDSDDVIEYLEVSISDIIFHFQRRTSDKEFNTWLNEQIDIAYERAIEDLYRAFLDCIDDGEGTAHYFAGFSSRFFVFEKDDNGEEIKGRYRYPYFNNSFCIW